MMITSAWPVALAAFVGILCQAPIVSANTYNVTSGRGCGKDGSLMTLEQAIELANNNDGHDIINIEVDISLSVNQGFCPVPARSRSTFKITDSVTINVMGNSKIRGPQAWVNKAGGVNDRSDNPCGDSVILASVAGSFLEVGTFGQNNTGLEVEINNLALEQTSQIANVFSGAKFTLGGGSAREIFDISQCSRSAIEVEGTLILKDFLIERTASFNYDRASFGRRGSPVINGIGRLEMTNSLITENKEGYAISWKGDAAIVSSVMAAAGAINHDGPGTMDVVNSVVDLTFASGQIYNQITSKTGGNLNFIASTIIYVIWTPDFDIGFPPSFPKGAIVADDKSTIYFIESAVHVRGSVENSYPVLQAVNGGGMSADNTTYIRATDVQNATELEAITNQPHLITEDGQFPLTGLYPQRITPLVDGDLIDVIPGNLEYPTSGDVIDKDVLGNPRVDGSGKRDIGAVQLSLAPHLVATDTDPGSVLLTWSKIDTSATVLPTLSGYDVCYGEGDQPADLSGGCSGTNETVNGADVLNTTILGLNSTLHWFAVKGIQSNAWSNFATAIPIGPVDIPTVTSAVCNGDGTEVTLLWDAVTTAGYNIAGYRVFYHQPNAVDEPWTLFEETAELTSTVTGLDRGENYEFGVKAVADRGLYSPNLGIIANTCQCPAGEAYIPPNYWVPPLDKPGMTCDNVRLKIPDHGEFSCLPIGEGICRDNGGNFGKWRFGVEEVDTPPCELFGICPNPTTEPTDTFPVLIDPALTRYPITGTTFTDSETGKICKNGYGEAIRGCNYRGTTHICISENIESDPNRYSNERPYMFFYNEKTHQYLYQLVCDGIGEEGKLPELKMVNQEELADKIYVNYPVDLVKFKKGATPNKDDSNELWKMYMDWNGFEDPETRRRGKLASFIGVAHPNLCKEYVSPTNKACWKKDEDCDDGTVNTPADYELDNCEI